MAMLFFLKSIYFICIKVLCKNFQISGKKEMGMCPLLFFIESDVSVFFFLLLIKNAVELQNVCFIALYPS